MELYSFQLLSHVEQYEKTLVCISSAQALHRMTNDLQLRSVPSKHAAVKAGQLQHSQTALLAVTVSKV